MTGVQTCALPISPVLKNGVLSRNMVNNISLYCRFHSILFHSCGSAAILCIYALYYGLCALVKRCYRKRIRITAKLIEKVQRSLRKLITAVMNGHWLKSIRFKLPIIENDLSIGLDNGEHETATLGGSRHEAH